MCELPAWLPPLVLLQDYHGDWGSYLDALYDGFSKDFLGQRPKFRGKRTGLKRHPVVQGKEATFWHFIQEGPVEEDRIPDLRRCERIRWVRAIMEHEADPSIKSWTEERGSSRRVHLWHEEAEYLAVLDEREEYVLPWTAYTVTQEHRKQKLRKRYERWRKS